MDRCMCRSIQTRTQRSRFHENHNFKSDFQTALYFGQSNFPRGLTPLLSLNRHSNTGIVISIVIFIVLLFPAASSSEFPGRSPSARYHLDTPPSPPRPQNRARRPRTSLGRQMRVSGRRSGDTTMARRRHQRHRVPAPLVWRRRAGMIAASSDTSSPPRATCPDILLDLVLA